MLALCHAAGHTSRAVLCGPVLDRREQPGGERDADVARRRGGFPQPRGGDDGVLVLAENVLHARHALDELARVLAEDRLDGLRGVASRAWPGCGRRARPGRADRRRARGPRGADGPTARVPARVARRRRTRLRRRHAGPAGGGARRRRGDRGARRSAGCGARGGARRGRRCVVPRDLRPSARRRGGRRRSACRPAPGAARAARPRRGPRRARSRASAAPRAMPRSTRARAATGTSGGATAAAGSRPAPGARTRCRRRVGRPGHVRATWRRTQRSRPGRPRGSS